MPIGATLGAAGIGAAAGLGSSLIGSSAAKSAAETQAAAAGQSAQLQAGAMDRATAAQSTAAANALGFQNKAFDYTTGTLLPYEQGIYNTEQGNVGAARGTVANYLSGAQGAVGGALDQARSGVAGYINPAQSMLQPAINNGNNANYTLAQLYGLPTPGNPSGGTADAASKIFAASPDYNFALQQGQLGVDRSNAAKGLTLSGGQIRDTATFNQGLATQTFGNYYNRLLSLSQLGQSAAGTNAGLASSGAGMMSNIGTAGAGIYGNLGTAGANATTSLAGTGAGLTGSMISGTNQAGATAGGIANAAGATGVSAANALGGTIVGGTQGIGNTMQQGAQAQASGTIGAANAITGGLNLPAAYAMNSQLRPNNGSSSYSDMWANSALNPSRWGNQPTNISTGSYLPSSAESRF